MVPYVFMSSVFFNHSLISFHTIGGSIPYQHPLRYCRHVLQIYKPNWQKLLRWLQQCLVHLRPPNLMYHPPLNLLLFPIDPLLVRPSPRSTVQMGRVVGMMVIVWVMNLVMMRLGSWKTKSVRFVGTKWNQILNWSFPAICNFQPDPFQSARGLGGEKIG